MRDTLEDVLKILNSHPVVEIIRKALGIHGKFSFQQVLEDQVRQVI